MPGVDLNYFMRQASKLTEKIEQRKKELAEETVEGKAGDGRVKVVATGSGERPLHQDRPGRRRPRTTSRCSRTSSPPRSTRRSARPASSAERELGKISGGSKIPGITG